MPPNVRDSSQVGSGFKQWWENQPPITKYLAAAMVVATVGAKLGFLPPVYFAYLTTPIFKKFEIWRLVTNFFFFKLGFNFLIRMLWLIQYGGQLETQTYQFEPADYLFALLFMGILLLVAAPFCGMALLGLPLITSIIYVWARNFPDQDIKLYGMITIKSFYLPFAFLAISLLMDQGIMSDIMGIVAGHIYYYLHDIYPRISARQILKTPAFLKQWLADAGLRGSAPTPAEAAGAPQGFQAFRGGGRRLGDR